MNSAKLGQKVFKKFNAKEKEFINNNNKIEYFSNNSPLANKYCDQGNINNKSKAIQKLKISRKINKRLLLENIVNEINSELDPIKSKISSIKTSFFISIYGSKNYSIRYLNIVDYSKKEIIKLIVKMHQLGFTVQNVADMLYGSPLKIAENIQFLYNFAHLLANLSFSKNNISSILRGSGSKIRTNIITLHFLNEQFKNELNLLDNDEITKTLISELIAGLLNNPYSTIVFILNKIFNIFTYTTLKTKIIQQNFQQQYIKSFANDLLLAIEKVEMETNSIIIGRRDINSLSSDEKTFDNQLSTSEADFNNNNNFNFNNNLDFYKKLNDNALFSEVNFNNTEKQNNDIDSIDFFRNLNIKFKIMQSSNQIKS